MGEEFQKRRDLVDMSRTALNGILTGLSALLVVFTVCMSSNAEEKKLAGDIIVIGAGGAGLPAAVTAAEAGAKVLLFEKMSSPGGSALYAEGMFAVDSPIQRKDNVGITKDEAFKLHMKYSHWRADPYLVRAIINKSGKTIQWLMDLGVEFDDHPQAMYPGALRTWHTIKGFGAGLINPLFTRAKELGVNIYFNTPAKKLIAKKGRITGVIAEDMDKNVIKAEAKAVIIATGGFANNREMLEKYTNVGPNVIPIGNKGKNGDGIKMSWEAGADSEGIDVVQRGMPTVRNEIGFTLLCSLVIQPYLWVNTKGERFYDESEFDFPHIGNATANQPGELMFVVFDENTKKYMMEQGIDIGVGIHVPVATKLTKLDELLARGIKKGEAWSDTTIEGLAKKMQIPVNTFVDTVKKYNAFCDKGHDDQFAKNPKYLHPIKLPPYYAVRGVPTNTGTIGGIKINHNTEVLDKKGEPIAGLYATGNDAGGLYGDTYDAEKAGLTLGFAVNSGIIAAENALQYIGK